VSGITIYCLIIVLNAEECDATEAQSGNFSW